MNKHCEEYKYGNFSDMGSAKDACKNDKNCSGVYDVSCGDINTFHLCKKMDDVMSYSDKSCIHDKIIIGSLTK